MSKPDTKAIARRFIQVWGDGDLDDLIDELADPSLTVFYPAHLTVVRGPQDFKLMMTNFRTAFPDAALRIDDELAEGEKAAIRWTFSGTHKGSLMGIPASYNKVTWTGITIYRIVGGKVVEERGEEDFLGFLRQIGIPPQ